MKDAYEILGLDKSSSKEELENRYKELKKEYGEGRFKAGEEGMQAARNLNDLENAWMDVQEDLRIREALEMSESTEKTENSAQENAVDEQELKAEQPKKESSESADTFAYIEQLIKEEKYDDAQSRLDNVMDRNGEWHYLQSKIYYRREWLAECKKQLEIAVECDPSNAKYKSALDNLEMMMGNKNADPSKVNNRMDGNYQSDYEYQNQNAGNSLLSCCSTYCLVSMCCDMCSLCCRM